MSFREVEVASTITVTDIDDIQQVVKAELLIFALYDAEAVENLDGEDVFLPENNTQDFFIPNIQVGLVTNNIMDNWDSTIKTNAKQGRILLVLRNTFDVAQEFEFSTFPFDTQKIKISLFSTNSKLINWISDSSLINIKFDSNSKRGITPQVDYFRNIAPNWRLEGATIDQIERSNTEILAIPGSLTYKLTLRRNPGYFNINYTMTVFVSVITSVSLLGIPIDDIVGRMSIVVTLLLTLTALKLVLADISPRSSSPTYLDIIIVASFLLMLCLSVEMVIVSKISDNYDELPDEIFIGKDDRITLERFDIVYQSSLILLWIIFFFTQTCGVRFNLKVFSLASLFSLKKMNNFIGLSANPGQVDAPIQNAQA